MVISVSSVREYTPEWNGNRDDSNPIIIEHKAPTNFLRDRLVSKPQITITGDTNGKDQHYTTTVVVDVKKIVETMVVGIRNLELEVDGKTVQITKGKDLYGENVPAVLYGLVDEVGQYLQNLLQETEIDIKN